MLAITRYLSRDRIAILAALVAPLAAPILLPFRASWPNTNVDQLLVVVGVGVAAIGNRAAGGLAAAWAAWPPPGYIVRRCRQAALSVAVMVTTAIAARNS